MTPRSGRTVPSPARSWLSDFGWADGRIQIRKTGVALIPDRHVAAEVWQWAQYLLLTAAVVAARRVRRRPAAALWFTPERPRPWYLVRGAALWSGIAAARSPQAADAAFYFNDVTRDGPPEACGLPVLNGACLDVSKSRVARVFEEVFGYPLSVDPARTPGPMVEKSEKNGVHDGRIVEGPLPPRPGYVYQRVVDTADDRGFCRDLRTPCVGGVPVLVWIKEKACAGRFAIHNRRATLHQPEDLYSPEELRLIGVFAARMGLDWGGLDILRDRGDGRIYIVDVNKTDLGPLIALSWTDKVRSLRRLGAALERLILAARQAPPAPPPEAERHAA